MTVKQNSNPTPANMQQASMAEYPLVKKLCTILAVIVCLVYANTLSNGYVLDDGMMISDNHYVKQGFKGIPDLLVTPHLKGYASDLTDTYRPLSLVMFAIEYQFFGETPAIGHLFNILFFAGAVLLLFLFLHKLFDRQRILLVFIAALLFAVHPIHTEVVASIKSRDEILCFFFAFLSLSIFIDYARQGKLHHLLLGTLCLFLSIISKETTATFIVIVPVVFFFYINDNRKRAFLITAATIIVIAVYTIIRAIIINKYQADGIMTPTIIDNPLLGAPTIASRIATAIMILGRYLKLLIVPYPLIFDYSYNSIPYVGFGNIWVLLSLAAYIGLIVCGIYRLFRNKKDPWAFGILFFLFTIVLFSNIPFLIWGAQADRWIFFASAGICLLLALVIEKWILRSQDIAVLRSRKVITLIVVCCIYAASAINRNTDWRDDYSLYKADVEKSPNNTRIYAFMGTELQKKYENENDPEKKAQINSDGILYLKRSLEIYPDNASAHAALGTAYQLASAFDSSVVHFKRALELNPKQLIAISNLATLYIMQERYAAAIPYFCKTVSLEPGDVIAWFNLAVCYSHIPKTDSALFAFNKTIAIDPSYNGYAAYINTAIIYKMTGRIDSAKKYEAITKQYIPGFSLDSIANK